jgi:hypothetical protein
MTGESSAFATLGLRAGAGRAEVDEAYRRLIKRYHPDRTGGDGSRAAEINRAYTVLRQNIDGPVRPRRRVPVPVQPRPRPRRRRRAGWLVLGVVVTAAGIGAASSDRRRRVRRPGLLGAVPVADVGRSAGERGAGFAD